MSILFNKVERLNPQDREAPKKWYPSLKTVAQVHQREVAKEISDETTLNPKEAEMALEQLQKILNTQPADSKEALTVANIKSLNIRFTPGKSLKNALTDASFKPVESIVSNPQADK